MTNFLNFNFCPVNLFQKEKFLIKIIFDLPENQIGGCIISETVCACLCVCACVRGCVCVCVKGWGWGDFSVVFNRSRPRLLSVDHGLSWESDVDMDTVCLLELDIGGSSSGRTVSSFLL